MTATQQPTSASASGPGASPGASGSPARALSLFEGVKLVARREVVTQVRSRAWQISFIVMLVLVAGSILVMPLLGGLFSGSAPQHIAATSETAAVVEAAELPVTVVGSAQQAADLVASGEADAAVLPVSDLGTLTAYDGSGEVATIPDAPGGAQVFVLGNESVPNELIAALTVAPEGVTLVQPTAAPWMVYLLTVFFGIVYMMGAITYCSQIAQSVVEEKQTRIVEILLSTVSPRTIMAGKVIGNSLLALVQVASIAIVAFLTMIATGQFFVFALLGPAIIWFAVLFVVGFVLLAALYAGVAATVSRQEDVNSATSPLMFLIMIPYILSFMASSNPTLLTVMSYVPFSAPIAMPARVFTGDAAWWEPVLSLVILVATAAACIWVGAKLYENSILRTGGRVKLTEALKG